MINSIVFVFLPTSISNILGVYISKSKRSCKTFHVKAKILVDFHICISVPLKHVKYLKRSITFLHMYFLQFLKKLVIQNSKTHICIQRNKYVFPCFNLTHSYLRFHRLRCLLLLVTNFRNTDYDWTSREIFDSFPPSYFLPQ